MSGGKAIPSLFMPDLVPGSAHNRGERGLKGAVDASGSSGLSASVE